MKLAMKVMEYFKTVSKIKRNFFTEMSETVKAEEVKDKFKALSNQHQTIVDECELVQLALFEEEELQKQTRSQDIEIVHPMKH